jgi:hypothetical protein
MIDIKRSIPDDKRLCEYLQQLVREGKYVDLGDKAYLDGNVDNLIV